MYLLLTLLSRGASAKHFSPLGVLQGTSFLLDISSTMLFIPVMYNAFDVVNCPSGEHWLSSGWACNTGVHAAFIAFVSILSVAFVFVISTCKLLHDCVACTGILSFVSVGFPPLVPVLHG